MSLQNVEVIKQQTQNKKSWFQRHCPTFAAAGAAVGTMVVASSANAAGSVEGLFTTISTEMGGVSTGVLSILTILAGVVALLLGWAYVKKAR